MPKPHVAIEIPAQFERQEKANLPFRGVFGRLAAGLQAKGKRTVIVDGPVL